MKSVTICGSMKFATEMTDWGAFLQMNGITANVPDLVGNDVWNSANSNERRALAKQLAVNHFRKIDNSSVVFIFNKDGYAGPSVTLEIGYAIACQRPLFALCEDTNEVCRDVWFDGYCKTKESLLEILKK